jgi:hypothetical protein
MRMILYCRARGRRWALFIIDIECSHVRSKFFDSVPTSSACVSFLFARPSIGETRKAKGLYAVVYLDASTVRGDHPAYNYVEIQGQRGDAIASCCIFQTRVQLLFTIIGRSVTSIACKFFFPYSQLFRLADFCCANRLSSSWPPL